MHDERNATGAGECFALFEDTLVAEPSALLLEGLRHRLVARTPAEARAALARIEAERARGWWVALAAHYELGSVFEPAVPAAPHGEPLLRAWVFERGCRLAGARLDAWWRESLGRLSPQDAEAGVLHLTPAWDAARHARAAGRALDHIRAGDCYQVNPTFPQRGEVYGHPLALYARLRAVQPVAHGVLVRDGEEWICSRSPELFFSRSGQRLTCRPMKGTAPRVAPPDVDPDPDVAQADAAAAASLLASDKERAENLMIVDLIRNDLGRLTGAGGVRVERLWELEAYPTVYLLTSTVTADPVGAGLEEILGALFPSGSVTGAPKIRAMQVIHALEDGPRGLYCGGLGWLAPDGDLSLNVPIRTLLVGPDRRFRLDVGSGIVADSEPGSEYHECLAKAAFVTGLDADLRLIETLRWESGRGCALLDGHLRRLASSAAVLGFPCDPGQVRAEVEACGRGLGPGVHRVRLLLGRDGRRWLDAAPLEPLRGVQRFDLAGWPLDPRDPRLAHKTTARRFYNEELKAAAGRGLFDIVFANARGELCEGARSTLFVEVGGRILTPAATSGVLPGVLRASLLASGWCEEAVLTSDDLARARQVWLGNALRGLVEVRPAGAAPV
nr:aminodeoxychorismate synthase, component I [Propionibacterium sp.]